MLSDDYTLDSVPDAYRRAYYSYLNENDGLNSEQVMTGPQYVKWMQDNHIEPA